MIEQPEIHVHPKQQADLGEVFVQSYISNGNRFLIETHSIHILERLGRIIRETTNGSDFKGMQLTPEDVAVYFVNSENEEGAVLKRMELRSDGRLKRNWPSNFLTRIWLIYGINDVRFIKYI